jgi:hypothetical protein
MSLSPSDRSGPVVALVSLLQEGLRSLFFRTPEDPVHWEILEKVRLAFGPVWDLGPSLTLALTEDGVEWEGCSILSKKEHPGGLGTQLLAGGVGGVVFTPGVEADEMIRFLQVIHEAGLLGDDEEDDLKTLLWREDFNHLHYTVTEAPAEEAALPLTSRSEEPVAPADNIREKVREDAGTGDRSSGVVEIEKYDSTLYFLDRVEIDYLKGAIEEEYAQNHAKSVVSLLLDTIELQPEAAVRDEIIEVLESLLPQLLGGGDFLTAAFLIEEVRSILESPVNLSPKHKAALGQFILRLSEPEALGQLFHVLHDSDPVPPSEELTRLFSHLRPEVMGTLFLWLQRFTRQDAKDVLLSAVHQIMRKEPRALSVALGSSDGVVVLRALDLVKRFQIESATKSLADLKSHPDPNTRTAVVAALAAIRSSDAFRVLTPMLSDPKADVRIGVLQALINRPFQGAMPRLRKMLEDPELEDRDLTEKRVLFEAFGVLAGPSGTEPLSGVLRGKAVFGRRKPSSDTRACAALALGKIGTPQARNALEKSLRDKDPVVRNAATRALKGEG